MVQISSPPRESNPEPQKYVHTGTQPEGASRKSKIITLLFFEVKKMDTSAFEHRIVDFEHAVSSIR